MNGTCSICSHLGRPCSTHPDPEPAAAPAAQIPPPKLTPRQNALLKQLRATPEGVPLKQTHTATVEGLMRRRLATVWNGQVRLIDTDTPPDAA